MAAVAAWAAANAGTIALATAGLSAVSLVSASQQRAAQMRLEAQQAELQGRQNALNYNRQANQILERQQQLAAAARARAAAGGIDPFSGSPMTIQEVDAIKAAREIGISADNATLSVYGGLAQSQSLQAAAGYAQTSGLISAATTAGQGYLNYLGTQTPTPEQVPAPVRTVNVNQ